MHLCIFFTYLWLYGQHHAPAESVTAMQVTLMVRAQQEIDRLELAIVTVKQRAARYPNRAAEYDKMIASMEATKKKGIDVRDDSLNILLKYCYHGR